MIAQHGYRSMTNPMPLDLEALERCLYELAEVAAERRAGVHMPRNGTGLGGGRWDEIEPLIHKTLLAAGVPITVYDLPPADSRN